MGIQERLGQVPGLMHDAWLSLLLCSMDQLQSDPRMFNDNHKEAYEIILG